jgi:hypothetical protein
LPLALRRLQALDGLRGATWIVLRRAEGPADS